MKIKRFGKIIIVFILMVLISITVFGFQSNDIDLQIKEVDENWQQLDYFPLNDGTYAVGVGKGTELCEIIIPEKYLGRNKRLNTLEANCKLYYDTKSKALYKMDSMDKNEFLYLSKLEEYRYKIRNGYASKYIISKYKNREVHLMKNIYDYTPGYKNYLLIKDTDNCYICTGSYYPSPTGRPSNKYPYPVRKYGYSNNYSYATYLKLSNTKLILK